MYTSDTFLLFSPHKTVVDNNRYMDCVLKRQINGIQILMWITYIYLKEHVCCKHCSSKYIRNTHNNSHISWANLAHTSDYAYFVNFAHSIQFYETNLQCSLIFFSKADIRVVVHRIFRNFQELSVFLRFLYPYFRTIWWFFLIKVTYCYLISNFFECSTAKINAMYKQ